VLALILSCSVTQMSPEPVIVPPVWMSPSTTRPDDPMVKVPVAWAREKFPVPSAEVTDPEMVFEREDSKRMPASSCVMPVTSWATLPANLTDPVAPVRMTALRAIN